ncbi:MAG TPA: hypothetical protein VFA27_10105 [Vicinamibacterales bacterium]|nr:hypothetical protein [Vicinamibacterales bacterium]
MTARWIAALAAVVAAGSLVACSNSSPSSTTAPTPAKTTDTFSGTVAVKGSDPHSFTVNAAGQVDVTLTAATPNVPLGLSVGTSGGSGCVAVAGGSVVTTAGTVAQLSGVLSPATYCVAVFDVGNLSQSVSYTVTVAHP